MFRRTTTLAGWLLGLPALLGVAACSGSEEEALARSIVLITLDTTRADALGCYGGRPETSPNLDALAAESLRYNWARTVTPLTLPAHTSMFTGYYPLRHGVRGNGPLVVPQSAETLAERARWAGYETAGFVGALALDEAFGIRQGFRVWQQPEAPIGRTAGDIPERSASDVVASAVHFLGRRNPTRPFFLWVHLFDPHAPYEPPPEFYDRPDPYLAEIAGMDQAIGRLLDALGESGVLDGSLIAVVGDHGEGRGDHGEATHGYHCYDSTMRVPFLLHYPDGWRAGEASDEIVSVADVFPTLLEFMGKPVPKGLDGVSLLRRSVPEGRGVYFESYHGWQSFGWSPITGWADAEGKYLHDTEPRFFQPQLDANETADLIDEDVGTKRYVQAIGELDVLPKLENVNRFSVSDDVLASLAQLGYGEVGESPAEYPHPLENTGRPTARERQAEFEQFIRGTNLIATGDFRGAIPVLEAVCETNPWNIGAHDALAMALLRTRDYERTLAVLRHRLTLAPEKMATHRDLVICYEALGDARAAYDHSVRSLELLVQTYERQQKREEASRARAQLQRVRTQAPPAAESEQASPEGA